MWGYVVQMIIILIVSKAIQTVKGLQKLKKYTVFSQRLQLKRSFEVKI